VCPGLGGLAGAGQARRTEQADLSGQRIRVYGVTALGDRLTHEVLRRGGPGLARPGPARG